MLEQENKPTKALRITPEEIAELTRGLTEKVRLFNRPRNRLSRRIHQLARWIEKYP